MGSYRAYILRFAIIGITTESSVAIADDCSFARANVDAYRENCAAIDGCANTERLEAVVDAECGLTTRSERPAAKKTTSSLSSEDLAGLQVALKLLGYAVGKADGVIGPSTRSAVAAFQRENDLPITGELDESTISALISKAQKQQKLKAEVGSACRALERLKNMDFEKEWILAVERIKIFKEAEGDLEKLRDELLSEANWTVSNWRESATYLAQTTVTTTNLIGNLLEFNPATGAVASAGRAARRGWETLKQAIDLGQSVYTLVTEELDKAIFEILLGMLAERNTTARITKTLYDFSNDIATAAQMPSDFATARQEVADQLNHLEYQLRNIQNKLMSSRQWIEIRRNFIEAATRSCEEERAGNRLP